MTWPRLPAIAMLLLLSLSLPTTSCRWSLIMTENNLKLNVLAGDLEVVGLCAHKLRMEN